MKRRKLNYRIHNPNTVEATADHLLKILMESNSEKVEKEIRAVADISKKVEYDKEFSA